MAEYGKEYIYNILKEKDPESAEKLHFNDVKRVIRALEIYEITGKPKSLQKDELIPRFDFVAVSVDYPREELYERINLRVEQMFDAGLIDEVQRLLDNGITEEMQCMQGIGYKEVAEGLKTNTSIDEIKELVKKNTRNYAKRQNTFFKRMSNHVKIPRENADWSTVEKLLY